MKPERPARPARIALVGEAPGEQEALLGRPFVGAAGTELNLQLKAAGLLRSELFLTNVFDVRPEKNDVENFCYEKGTKRLASYSLPPIRAGRYFREEIALPALERLHQELATAGEDGPPNILVALGNTAMWALCQRTGIGSLRGTLLQSTLLPGTKVLPTYHPAAVLRDYSLGAIAISDLMKAKRESEYPEIRRPARRVLIPETVEDVLQWNWQQGSVLAFDIETIPARRILQCIGLASTPTEALVVPFTARGNESGSYWSPTDEVRIWRWLKSVLESPFPKVAQNGAYDVLWLEAHNIMVRGWRADTMIAHHALFPELQKSLGFLGSIYTDEVAWKGMRPRGSDSGKREDE
jgi:uracil-DNA glycosylase